MKQINMFKIEIKELFHPMLKSKESLKCPNSLRMMKRQLALSKREEEH